MIKQNTETQEIKVWKTIAEAGELLNENRLDCWIDRNEATRALI